jgi:redox-sensing transcriptional repressor
MPCRKVPEGTVTRLCDYLRALTVMERRAQSRTSSAEIARWAGVKDSQVRKDLSYFGEFGRRGLGYEVSLLRTQIQDILGVHRHRPTIVVGAGNLGSALARYGGFGDRGFQLVAAFDSSPQRIGQMLGEVTIMPLAELKPTVRQLGVEIALIAVPATAAQTVAELVVEAGVRAIINFAPVILTLPPMVKLRNVDLARELETLCYYLPSSDNEEPEIPGL